MHAHLLQENALWTLKYSMHAASKIVDYHQAKILVVDDCGRHAGSVAELLRLQDYANVQTLTDPTQVVTLHAAHDYDLILLDLCMPEVDGFAVMELLKHDQQEELLPVLVITGYTSKKNDALAAGALDVITKPYDFAELGLRIRNALRVRLLYKDLTQRVEKHRLLALHDPLTGLPNRRSLMERVENALQLAQRNAKHMAVLYIDLDRFKEVNDRFGHACGDLLLKNVANRLSHCVRQTDTVGRLGGDEFLMVLSEVRTPEEAAIPASKIVQSLSTPFILRDYEAQISASVGIAVYPEHGKSAEVLVRTADAALYGMKKSGKNGYRFALERVHGVEQEPRQATD